jgi:spermidine synthase
MVFDSATYGRVLVLDGAIQLTERDEFAYQEAIVHLPMFAHPNPKRVLIVGGGDGGVLREVCRHACVEKVRGCVCVVACVCAGGDEFYEPFGLLRLRAPGEAPGQVKEEFTSEPITHHFERLPDTSRARLTPITHPHTPNRQVVMCEIDRRVCDVSKEFFADSMATAFNDPRATLLYMDAAIYMKEHKNEFDVIIVDSSDPVGPAETLYTSSFYSDMHGALRDGGVVCTQGECQFLHLDLIRKVMGDAQALYATVDYAYSTVPTYPDGQIGYIIAHKSTGKADRTFLRTPKRRVPDDMRKALRLYSEELHAAAFVLPAFAAKKLGEIRAPQDAVTAVAISPLSVAVGAVLGASAVVLFGLLSKRK